jgi:hypothetical protein
VLVICFCAGEEGNRQTTKTTSGIAIPPGAQTMSVTVAVDPAKATSSRQATKALTYSASAALVFDEFGGQATGLQGTISK